MADVSGLLKKHWLAAAIAGLGIIVIYRYTTGSSASATQSSGSDIGSFLQGQAALAAQNSQTQSALQIASMQAGVAEDQLAAQATVANNQATATLAQSTGQAIAGIISAQAQIPAMAINAAQANNQTTLQNAAQVAIAEINTLPQAMEAQANQIVATSQQFNSYLNAAGQSQSNFNANMPILVNAVAQSAATQTTGTSAATSASANSNAQSNAYRWNTIGTVGMGVLGSMF